MRKVVLHAKKYIKEFNVSLRSRNRYNEIDKSLKEKYGLVCIHGFLYNITDEAKFSIFALKYNDLIIAVKFLLAPLF